MLRLIRGIGLLTLLGAFVLPLCGADVKKEGKDGDIPKTKDKDHVDYVTVGTYEGNVKQVAQGTKTFTLELVQRMPDPQAVARLAQLQQQLAQQQAQARPQNGFNRQAIANTLNQINQQQLAVNRGIEKKVDKQFEASEDVKVRVSDLPVEFENGGKPKKLTKAELAEKKGPGNLWGFPAEFEQLTVGQHVRIMVGVKKAAYEAAKKKKKTPPKKGTKPSEEDVGDLDDPPLVWQIHILVDGNKR